MAEERDQVVLPTGSPLAPDLPVTPAMGATELDDVDVPRSVSTVGLGPGGSGDRVDVGVVPGAAATAGTGAVAVASDDPDRIREQIERTREDMSQTINELQARLSPQHLAQQARDTVREATVGRVQQMVGTASDTASQVARRAQEAAGPVVEQVREHPLPLALAGAGAGLMWYLMRRSSSRQTWSSNDMYEWDDDATGTRDYASLDVRDDSRGEAGWLQMLRDNPVPATIAAASIGYMLWSRRSAASDAFDRSPAFAGYDDNAYDTSTGERLSAAARDMRRQASEKASEIGGQVSETASALGQQVSEKASALSHQVSEKASAISHQVSDQVSGTVRSARVRAGQLSRDTSTQFDRWMQDNPMAIGVAALAAGAVVGLTVPVTNAENRAMGASRDALLERASDSAQEIKDQVRDKVQEVRTKVEEVAGELATTASNATKTSDGPAGV